MDIKTMQDRTRVQIDIDPKEARTHQSFRDECDIRTIMRRWAKGQAPHMVNLSTPIYGDFTNVPDYLEAVNRVREAKMAFAALPARVRSLCDNDPAVFLDWIQDPANHDEAVELGLMIEPEPAEPAGPPAKAAAGATPPEAPEVAPEASPKPS